MQMQECKTENVRTQNFGDSGVLQNYVLGLCQTDECGVRAQVVVSICRQSF